MFFSYINCKCIQNFTCTSNKSMHFQKMWEGIWCFTGIGVIIMTLNLTTTSQIQTHFNTSYLKCVQIINMC